MKHIVAAGIGAGVSVFTSKGGGFVMALSADAHTLAYRWTKYTSYAYEPKMSSIVGLASLGIVGCVASFALSVPLVSLVFLVVLYLPIAMLTRFRTKLVIVDDGVAAHRQ
ncbi:hypothetical protein G3I15_08885, partial [Streptomyces sp. SID10244]|nr:hypothetical protein [Streptomyces sp. SID10244]